MKKMLVTAAALMLGTSALAWAPAEKAQGAMDMAKVETAGLEASASTIKSDSAVPEMFAKWEDPSVTATANGSADMADVKGAVFAASMDEKASVQTASWDGKAEGAIGEQPAMGGPIEEPQGYPACEPGRGDDNCIQLYERGVERALEAWKGSEAEVAVGGPFEPAPAAAGSKDHAAHSADHQGMDHGQSGTATGHDASATADSGKPAAPVMPQSDAVKPGGATSGTSPGAIGGPIESVSDYPPCRPGRGDDRCIQLYERGVARRD